MELNSGSPQGKTRSEVSRVLTFQSRRNLEQGRRHEVLLPDPLVFTFPRMKRLYSVRLHPYSPRYSAFNLPMKLYLVQVLLSVLLTVASHEHPLQAPLDYVRFPVEPLLYRDARGEGILIPL